jgi:hypothetical protein
LLLVRNEYLERENTRLKSELHEEVKKREYAERESARNAPLTARVGKLAEENEMVKNENENLRSRVRRYEAESIGTPRVWSLRGTAFVKRGIRLLLCNKINNNNL